MLDGVLKHRAGPAETVAGIEQAIDLRSVPRPLLDHRSADRRLAEVRRLDELIEHGWLQSRSRTEALSRLNCLTTETAAETQ